MKTLLKWLAAAVVTVAATAAAWFLVFRMTRIIPAHSLPKPGETAAFKHTEQGLRRIQATAFALGGNEADRSFIKTFSDFLASQPNALSDSERERLAKGLRTFDELLAFKEVGRVARIWAEGNGVPRKAEGMVLVPPNEIKGFAAIEPDLLRAAQNDGIPKLHARAHAATAAIGGLQASAWPFQSLDEISPASTLSRALAAKAPSDLDIAQVPTWFPLFSKSECEALVIREAMAKDESLVRLLSKSDFGHLYDSEGHVDLRRGIDANTMSRIQAVINNERRAVLAAVDDPNSSQLTDKSDQGPARARTSINARYDAVIRFIESFSSDNPPSTNGKGAFIGPGNVPSSAVAGSASRAPRR